MQGRADQEGRRCTGQEVTTPRQRGCPLVSELGRGAQGVGGFPPSSGQRKPPQDSKLVAGGPASKSTGAPGQRGGWAGGGRQGGQVGGGRCSDHRGWLGLGPCVKTRRQVGEVQEELGVSGEGVSCGQDPPRVPCSTFLLTW